MSSILDDMTPSAWQDVMSGRLVEHKSPYQVAVWEPLYSATEIRRAEEARAHRYDADSITKIQSAASASMEMAFSIGEEWFGKIHYGEHDAAHELRKHYHAEVFALIEQLFTIFHARAAPQPPVAEPSVNEWLLAALRELVAVKALKDRTRTDLLSSDEMDELQHAYKIRQPLSWATAKRAIEAAEQAINTEQDISDQTPELRWCIGEQIFGRPTDDDLHAALDAKSKLLGYGSYRESDRTVCMCDDFDQASGLSEALGLEHKVVALYEVSEK